MRLALALVFIATPAFADIDRALDDHILPGHQQLAEATWALASVAAESCAPETVRPAFNTAYDAWLGVSHIQFGPIEEQGLSLAMSFWPDPKDSTGKALGRLIATGDPIIDTPSGFDDVSAAAQGFTALERLLYQAQTDPDYSCRLVQAVSEGLARNSEAIAAGWSTHAELMQTAGSNDRYQSTDEVQRALYTALSSGLEFLHDQRLGRPLGTFNRPRPLRAEARRSNRSLRHVELNLVALENLATTLTESLPETQKAFAAARERAKALDDPTFQGVADPAKRFKVEVLQQAVRAIQLAVVEDIGKPLGIQAGFNSLDGD